MWIADLNPAIRRIDALDSIKLDEPHWFGRSEVFIRGRQLLSYDPPRTPCSI
jgi:hypothetical protein